MLFNTVWRLTHEKKLTIGYFGGSITEGAGASSRDNCWRSLVNGWFRDTWPEAQITEIQAAIGGTGTALGMFRCQRDLLEGKPDLVFLEYAVNDNGVVYENICMQMETIIRKIRCALPETEIVTVITTTGPIHEKLQNCEDYRARTAHTAVSRHYGIPTVDIGEALRTQVLLEGGDFRRYTTDMVHPNDTGYRLYADCMIRWLGENLKEAGEGLRAYPMPERFCPRTQDGAHMEDCGSLENFTSDGFVLQEVSLCGRYPHYLEGTRPGDCFSFTFTGENLGFYLMLARDGGDASVVIDGREYRIRCWDIYSKGYDRAGAAIFAKDLPEGEHHVTVTVLPDHAEESLGTAVRIAAAMVS